MTHSLSELSTFSALSRAARVPPVVWSLVKRPEMTDQYRATRFVRSWLRPALHHHFDFELEHHLVGHFV